MAISRKNYFFMSCSPKTTYTTLEATLRRRNRLSPTGTKVNLHWNLIGFCQIYPTVHFFSCTISVWNFTSPSCPPKRGKIYQTSLKKYTLKLNFFVEEICSTIDLIFVYIYKYISNTQLYQSQQRTIKEMRFQKHGCGQAYT